MNANVDEFLTARAHARAVGDRSLEQAMNAELARLGYRETPHQAPTETAAVATVERATPPAKRRRAPRATT